MALDARRKRDFNTMFAINYEDGRTAYISPVRPQLLEHGDDVTPAHRSRAAG